MWSITPMSDLYLITLICDIYSILFLFYLIVTPINNSAGWIRINLHNALIIIRSLKLIMHDSSSNT